MKKLLTVAMAAFAIGVVSLIDFNPKSDWISYDEFLQVSSADARSRGGFSRGFSSRSSFSFKRKSSSSGSLWNRTVSKPKVGSSGGYKKKTAVSSKSSGGYKKKTTANAGTKPKTSGGYGKSGASASKKKSFNKESKLAKRVQSKKASAALASKRKATSKFSKKASPSTLTSASSVKNNPIASKATRTKITYNTYYVNRDRYYGGIGWHPSPYMYGSYTSFGLWDAMFMWSMMDLHRDMYYHHRRDPGFQEWRREADRMAADNAELRAKLAKLDAEVTQLEAKGVKADAAYMPKDVDAQVALAAEVVASATGDLTLAMGTGGKSGNYFAYCNDIKANAPEKLKVTCVNTNGSVGNLEGIVSGKYGAAMVQSDVINEWLREHPGVKIDALQSSVYPEVVYLIANREADIEEIGDIDPKKHRLYFAGSGAAKTMAGFANQDSKYRALYRAGTQVGANEKLLKMVANNPKGVMMYVCGMNCGLIEKANNMYGKKLVMAAVNDWDFNDAEDQFGNNIYRFVEIPRIYKNLMPGSWVGSDSIETLAVDAILIVSQEWVEEKGVDGLADLETAIWPAMSTIQQKVGVPE